MTEHDNPKDNIGCWVGGVWLLCVAGFWSMVGWFVVSVAWPWLIGVLRANGVKGL